MYINVCVMGLHNFLHSIHQWSLATSAWDPIQTLKSVQDPLSNLLPPIRDTVLKKRTCPRKSRTYSHSAPYGFSHHTHTLCTHSHTHKHTPHPMHSHAHTNHALTHKHTPCINTHKSHTHHTFTHTTPPCAFTYIHTYI